MKKNNGKTVVVVGFKTPEESFQSFWNDIIALKGGASALNSRMVAILLSLTFPRLDSRMEMDDALQLAPPNRASPLEAELKVSRLQRRL